MDFTTIANTLGVAVACLVALGFAVWKSVIWFGQNIAKPVADRHIKFLDDLTAAVASQSIAMQTIVSQLGKNLDSLSEMMIHVRELLDKHDELVRAVGEVRSTVSRMDVHADSVTLHSSNQGKDPAKHDQQGEGLGRG